MYYICLIVRVYVFHVEHVDKKGLYETLFHCNILSKHYHHHDHVILQSYPPRCNHISYTNDYNDDDCDYDSDDNDDDDNNGDDNNGDDDDDDYDDDNYDDDNGDDDDGGGGDNDDDYDDDN
jgi:hypothetical protein